MIYVFLFSLSTFKISVFILEGCLRNDISHVFFQYITESYQNSLIHLHLRLILTRLELLLLSFVLFLCSFYVSHFSFALFQIKLLMSFCLCSLKCFILYPIFEILTTHFSKI